MATKGDINATVGIGVKTETKLLKGLEDQLKSAINQLNKLTKDSLGTTEKMSASTAASVRQVTKAISQTEKAVQTLQKYGRGNQRILDFLGSDQQLQRQATAIRNVHEFRRSLDQATTTTQAFKARINDLDKAQVSATARGVKGLDNQIARQNKLRDALKEYESIQKRIGNVTVKGGVLSEDSRAKLAQFVQQVNLAQASFQRMAGDKRIFNFDTGLNQLRLATAEMEKQIRVLQQQDKQAKLTAQNILATNKFAERRQLITTANQAQSTGNFPKGQSETAILQRLERATLAYNRVKAQLNQAVVADAGSDRLNTLISRYNALKQILGQTIASQKAFTAESLKSGEQGYKIFEARARQAAQNAKLDQKDINAQAAHAQRLFEAKARQIRLLEKLGNQEALQQARQASKIFEARAKQLRDLAKLEETEANKRAADAYKLNIAYGKMMQKRYEDEQKEQEKLNKNQTQSSKLSQSINGLLGDGGLALGSRVGIYALAANGIYGVMNAAREAAAFVVDFEDKLAQLQAISSSTDQQMLSLSNTILEVSKSSRYSAVEIAEATVQLAQAGFSAKDLNDSLGAVTNFAAASGTSVSDSVDLITGAIGAFQLQASEASRITDIFTAALNRSRLTSQQIAQAIQYVGTTAYEQNISLEQMVATIGSVAQAGVRAGSTLGTGFRQFLVDLTNPTDKLKSELERLGISLADIDVKSRGLPQVLENLSKAGFGAAQAYEGLEVRAAAFYLAAKNNIDVYDQLMLAETQQGIALEANERAMDSLSAQWQRFKNILSDVANDNAPLDFLKELTKAASDYIEASQQASQKSKDFAKDISQNGITDLDQLFRADLVELFGLEVEKSFRKLADGAETAEERAYFLEKANASAADSLDQLATSTANANDQVTNQTQKISSLQTEMLRIKTQYDETSDNSIRLQGETLNLTSRFEGLQGMLGNTANAFNNLIIGMQRYEQNALRILELNQRTLASSAAVEQVNIRDAIGSQANALRGSKGYRALLPKQRARVDWALRNPNDIRAVTELSEVANQLPTDLAPAFRDLYKGLLSVSSNIGKNNILTNQINTANRNAGQAGALRTNVGMRAGTALTEIRAEFQRLRSGGSGMSEGERKKIASGLLSRLAGEQGYLEGVTRRKGITADQASAFRGQLGQFGELAGEIRGFSSQTAKEAKDELKAARAGQAAARKEEAAARRAEAQNDRNNLTAAQSRLTASGKSLDSYLTDGRNNLNGLINVKKMFEESDKLLTEWTENRQKVLAAAIEKGDMSPDQIAEMTKAANEEIEAKRRDTYGKQLGVVAKAFDDFIADQAHKLEVETYQAMQAPTRRLRLAEATSSGLSNPLYNIPEYTRVIAARQSDLARQEFTQRQIAQNENQFLGNNATIAGITNELASLKELREASGENIERDRRIIELNQTLDNLTRKNEELRLSTDELIATNNAINMKPKSFGEGLSQAATAFGIQNNIGIGLDERVIGNLGGAIESVHGSFQQFFSDVVTGTATVGQAFGNMAKSIISSLADMAAKAVATQIFGLLLSFIPGVGGKTGTASYDTSFSLPSLGAGLGRWNGGMIGNETPKRLISGGRVSNGLPTRDSTLVHAAEGEFMMRRSSVKSIGESLLSDMNNRGAAALKGLGDKNIVMPQSQLQSNVYVVLPEEQPTLGPADVLAVVSRDVLRGGATKQLIKQVAAGG